MSTLVEYIDTSKLVNFASNLCTFPTPLGQEKDMAEYIAEYLDQNGFDVELQYVVKDRPNVVAISRGDQDYKSFIFNGHLDMAMPYGNWKKDPYQPWIENDALYGAGIQDMKGGVAALVHGAIAVTRENFPNRGDVIVNIVMHHDTIGLGAKYFLESCPWKIDAGVCGEPTNLKLQLAHGGAYDFEINLRGVTRHQCRIEESVNAIDGMVRIIQALNVENLTYTPDPGFPYLPRVLVGKIWGGEGPSMAAEDCTIRGDIRFLPSMTIDGMKNDIKKIVESVCQELPGLSGRVTTFAQQWPYRISDHDEVVRIFVRSYKKVVGQDPVLTTGLPCGAFITDAADMIRHGISTILFGPGDWRTEPNENISFEDLTIAARVYALVCSEIVSSKRS